jgi:hypothetical protein
MRSLPFSLSLCVPSQRTDGGYPLPQIRPLVSIESALLPNAFTLLPQRPVIHLSCYCLGVCLGIFHGLLNYASSFRLPANSWMDPTLPL